MSRQINTQKMSQNPDNSRHKGNNVFLVLFLCTFCILIVNSLYVSIHGTIARIALWLVILKEDKTVPNFLITIRQVIKFQLVLRKLYLKHHRLISLHEYSQYAYSDILFYFSSGLSASVIGQP